MINKYLLSINLLFLLNCGLKFHETEVDYHKLASEIICALLESKHNPFYNKGIIYFRKREIDDIADPEIFSRKFVPADRDFNTLTKNINFNEVSAETKCLLSNKIIYIDSDITISDTYLEASQLYFFGRNKGFFVLYIACGINCGEANVFTFEIVKDEIKLKWTSPYYIE